MFVPVITISSSYLVKLVLLSLWVKPNLGTIVNSVFSLGASVFFVKGPISKAFASFILFKVTVWFPVFSTITVFASGAVSYPSNFFPKLILLWDTLIE